MPPQVRKVERRHFRKLPLVDTYSLPDISFNAERMSMGALSRGVTALQGAAISGNVAIVQLLLTAGADIDGAPAAEDGRTAIEGAAENGRLCTVQLLLKSHPNLRSAGSQCERAADLAAQNGHSIIAMFLRSCTIF
jgi:ankyrin repeat protein